MSIVYSIVHICVIPHIQSNSKSVSDKINVIVHIIDVNIDSLLQLIFVFSSMTVIASLFNLTLNDNNANTFKTINTEQRNPFKP